MLGMAERIRITFEVSDRARRALNICAARTNTSLGEVIEGLLEQLLPEDLAIADKAIADGADRGTNKRGRRPKTSD